MSEEIENAGVVVPRSMVWSFLLNLPFAFGLLLTYLFCMVDIDDALSSPTGYPFIYLFQTATGSTVASTILSVVVLVLLIMITISCVASTSRQTFAFARDDGLPFSNWLKTVRAPSPVTPPPPPPPFVVHSHSLRTGRPEAPHPRQRPHLHLSLLNHPLPHQHRLHRRLQRPPLPLHRRPHGHLRHLHPLRGLEAPPRRASASLPLESRPLRTYHQPHCARLVNLVVLLELLAEQPPCDGPEVQLGLCDLCRNHGYLVSPLCSQGTPHLRRARSQSSHIINLPQLT